MIISTNSYKKKWYEPFPQRIILPTYILEPNKIIILGAV